MMKIVTGARYREGRRPSRWTQRVSLCLAVIERHAPDLLGLQEAQVGNLEFWFSPTLESPSVGYGVDYPPGATWVKLLDRTTGRPLVHVNTHFVDGPAGAESRRNSARILIERMQAIAGDDCPVIATGDFTWNPGGEAHTLFLEAG